MRRGDDDRVDVGASREPFGRWLDGGAEFRRQRGRTGAQGDGREPSAVSPGWPGRRRRRGPCCPTRGCRSRWGCRSWMRSCWPCPLVAHGHAVYIVDNLRFPVATELRGRDAGRDRSTGRGDRLRGAPAAGHRAAPGARRGGRGGGRGRHRRAQAASAVADYPAAIIGLLSFRAAEIATLRRTGLLVRAGIGYDVIDVDAATAAGIWVANVPDYCVDEVADHAMLLLMAAWRRLPELEAVWQAGSWVNAALVPPVNRARGRRLGIVGFGRIGRAVARARAGVRVRGRGPRPVRGRRRPSRGRRRARRPRRPVRHERRRIAALPTDGRDPLTWSTPSGSPGSGRGWCWSTPAGAGWSTWPPSTRRSSAAGRGGRPRRPGGRAGPGPGAGAVPAAERGADAAPRVVFARGAARPGAPGGRRGLPLHLG